MKILSVNSKTSFKNKTAKQTNKQSNPVLSYKNDSVSFYGKKETEKTRAQKYEEYLKCLEQIKQIRKEEAKAEKALEEKLNKKMDKIDKEIKELTDDYYFVAETVTSEDEKTAWGNAAFAVQRGAMDNGISYEDSVEAATKRAGLVINVRRLKDPQKFLDEAAEKLKDPIEDVKYQQLKSLYEQKVYISKYSDYEKRELNKKYFNKSHDFEIKAACASDPSDLYFKFKAVKHKCNKDKYLQKFWDEKYNYEIKKTKDHHWRNKEEKKEMAKLNANMLTLDYLKGGSGVIHF